jgi:uncharacterized protein (TIGR03085 family)
VSQEHPARAERHALADLVARLGPDAPTLCVGWTTRDLAAHLIMRERRPDAAVGILLAPLHSYSERVRHAVAGRPYAELVEMVRNPPWWSWSALPPLDAMANAVEFFVHHEDVRRAQPQWQPRHLPAETERALWAGFKALARLRLRRFPAVVHLSAPGFGEIHAGAFASDDPAAPRVHLSGPPGELLIFCLGRQRAARVELTGPQQQVDALREARLGL